MLKIVYNFNTSLSDNKCNNVIYSYISTYFYAFCKNNNKLKKTKQGNRLFPKEEKSAFNRKEYNYINGIV